MRLETFLMHPAVQALGWSLLHFLWQGSLLALLLWVVQFAVPASMARVRYAAASLILLMMPVVLVITLAREFTHHDAGAVAPAAIAPLPVTESDAILEPAIAPASPFTMAGIPGWAVCVWIAGVLLLSLRAGGGWVRAQRLKRRASRAETELEELLESLKRRLRISAPVQLCLSAAAEVPTVIGWMRPYILLPITALTGLTEAQLEAVLAHELAHIRRHDYLVNLLQTAIETLLFYHPAVWWVGRQMRIEREHCCDDIAVGVCANAAEYAAALTELESTRHRVFEPALAATGGDLLSRIRRVLRQRGEDRVSRPLGTVAAAILVVLLTGVPALRSQAPAPPQPPAPPAPPAVKPVAPAVTVPFPPPTAQFPPVHANLPKIEIPEIDLALAQGERAIAQLSQNISADSLLLQDKHPERTPEERAKTVDFLIKLYDSEKNQDMKMSVLSYLARSDDKRAADKLLSVARSDPNQDTRMAAVSWLAHGTKSYDTLVSLYDSETNDEMRMALLSWIAHSEDPRAADKLMSVVKSNVSVEVREAALSFLVAR